MAAGKRILAGCMLLVPCLFLAGALWLQGEVIASSGQAAVPASSDNWGLSFPVEGEPPVGDTTQKVIYLTFDCGYENGCTEKILDALKKHNAPAAFFVVGHMVESAPDIVKRMAAEGHIVANHTYHHPDMSAISDQAAFQEELESLEALYQETVGESMPKYYRPPQGKYSVENLKQAQALGYKTILWSLAYVDWYTDNQPSAEAA